MKQRAVIKFYFKSGKTANEVYSDLKNVFGEVSRAVFQRFARFQDGSELENEPRRGRALPAWSNEKVEKTRPTAMKDWRKTTRVLDQRLGAVKERAMKSVEKDLQTRKICSRFVAHSIMG